MVSTTERVLETILHVSDVHFGDLDTHGGSASLDAVVPGFPRSHKYHGHHYIALVALEELYTRLSAERDDTPPRLIVSGDLTTTGHSGQFVIAKNYFESALGQGAGRVGLFAPGTLAQAICGNHDHWPGTRWILGPPHAQLATFLGSLPHVSRPIVVDGSHSVRIIRIDSDADVHPWWYKRLFAIGSFASQLQTVEGVLGAKPVDECRVLVLHHSPAHQSNVSHFIDAGTQLALAEFIRRQRISVLLTGHLHCPRAIMATVEDGNVSWPVVELRCGTTLQRTRPPMTWVARGKKADPKLVNTALVHRIVATANGAIEWRTTWYQRTDQQGFVDQGPIIGFTQPLRLW